MISGHFCTFANTLVDHHAYAYALSEGLPGQLSSCSALGGFSDPLQGLSALVRPLPSQGLCYCPGCDLIKACCCQWPVVARTRDGHHQQILSSKPLFVPSLSIVSCHPHPAIFTSHLNSSSQRWQQDRKKETENRLLATRQRGSREEGEASK